MIFISMGKFGQKYYSTSYKIEGDITSMYQYDFLMKLSYIKTIMVLIYII